MPNARVVELSAKAGMALGCNIAAETKWDRKVRLVGRFKLGGGVGLLNLPADSAVRIANPKMNHRFRLLGGRVY